jgi:hypothetical protein
MNRLYALLLGVAMLIGSVYLADRTLALKRDGQRATGIVVDRHASLTVSRDEFGLTFAPVVEFTTADGRRIRFRSDLWSAWPTAVDTQVEVLYRADDPQRARIDGVLENWLAPAVLGFLGLVSSLYSLGFLREGLHSTGPYAELDLTFTDADTRPRDD